jgi:hypothetical protein
VHIYDQKTGKVQGTIYPADGAAGDEFGRSVAISGSLLIVGSPRHDATGVDAGAAYVYDIKTRALLAKHTPGIVGEIAGLSVALEGRMAVIGVPGGDLLGGAPARGFVSVVDALSGVTISLLADPAGVAGDLLGSSVAVQGGMVIVGEPGDDTGAVDSGSVRVYDAVGGQLIDTLLAPAPAANNQLGNAIAFDGKLVVAGSASAGGGRGLVVSWRLSDTGSATNLGSLEGDTVNDGLGASLAVSQNLVAIGAPGSPADYNASILAGAVRLCTAALGTALPTLQPAGLPDTGFFGGSVALDGSTLVTSCSADSGLVSRDGTLWKFDNLERPPATVFAKIIAVTGDAAPGTANAQFSAFNSVAATGGMPIMLCSLSGAGTTAGKNTGIWSASAPSFEFRLAAQTGVLDGSGIRMVKPFGLIANLGGQITYWQSTLAGTGVTAASSMGLYRQDPLTGNVTRILRTGDVLAGGETVAKLGITRGSNSITDSALQMVTLRRSAAPVVDAASDSAIEIMINGGIIGQRREGVTTSLLGSPFGQMPPLMAANGNKSALIATTQLNPPAVTTANNVYIDDNGFVNQMQKGDSAPDSLGGGIGTVSAFSGVTLGGPLLFKASLVPALSVTRANNEGLWTNRGGATRLVLRKGFPAPTIAGGVVISRIVKYGINTFGNIVILAQLTGPGVTKANDMVLYLNYPTAAEPGDFRILLREGDIVPGTGGAKLGNILSVDFAFIPTFTNSRYGVLASLVVQPGIVSAADNQVWLVGYSGGTTTSPSSAHRPVLRLRKGTRLDAATGRDVITSLSMPADPSDQAGTLNNGLPHSLDGTFGTSTLRIGFASRKTALVNLGF